jgi:hypothetical protein
MCQHGPASFMPGDFVIGEVEKKIAGRVTIAKKTIIFS